MPHDWLTDANETRGQLHDDDHLSEADVRMYVPIIVNSVDKSGNSRPYENDADEIFVHNTSSASERTGEKVSFSLRLASLYTIFNSDFLTTNNITCIVNMAGCNASQGAAMYYNCDLAHNPKVMEGVNQLCGSNIKKLLEEGEEGFRHFYKEFYGIDWLAVEDAVDSWYYNISQHFAETNGFLEKHLQEYKGKGRVNIVVSCYGGYNRSASVAIAFLLKHFKEMSLVDILNATCPKRPLMLSKEKWQPNKVQSKFLKELIEYEKRLHDETEPLDSCYHSQLPPSPTGATEASDTPTRQFTPIPLRSSDDIHASPRHSNDSPSTTEEFDDRSGVKPISYWGQQWDLQACVRRGAGVSCD